MRRTASEAIRSLEARIAQLEGKASRKASDIDPRIQNPGVHLFLMKYGSFVLAPHTVISERTDSIQMMLKGDIPCKALEILKGAGAIRMHYDSMMGREAWQVLLPL